MEYLIGGVVAVVVIVAVFFLFMIFTIGRANYYIVGENYIDLVLASAPDRHLLNDRMLKTIQRHRENDKQFRRYIYAVAPLVRKGVHPDQAEAHFVVQKVMLEVQREEAAASSASLAKSLEFGR
ncbi:MAG: hypothetical protein ABJL54_16015 [Halioglobus sp.]